MEKSPVMADLEQADQRRRLITQEFSRLHATFQLLHNHFEALIDEGVAAEERAKLDLEQTLEEYSRRLQIIDDAKRTANASISQARRTLANLDDRKREYEKNDIAGKILQVDSMAAWDAELKPLKDQLADLEKEVKSLSEIFAAMETEANNQARDRITEWDGKKPGIYEAFAKRKEALTEAHTETLKSIRLRHEPELETANTKITEFKTQQAALGVEVKQVQADPDALQFLAIERQKQTDANDELSDLHDKTNGLQKTYNKFRRDYDDLELQVNGGDNAIEKAETELEELLAADSAGDDTFLGFLRRNKPNWAADIGRVVSPETLLRSDLAPVLSDGSTLYGVSIDLDQLTAGRYSSEETIQQEIKLVRTRLDKRKEEVAEDRKLLAKTKEAMDKAKTAISLHEAAIATAKNRKQAADTAVKTALQRVEHSKKGALTKAQAALDACVENLTLAVRAQESLKSDHRKELEAVERLQATNLHQLKSEESSALREIDTHKKTIEADLAAKIKQIASDRDASLRDKGYSTDVLNALRDRISTLEKQIADAAKLRTVVTQYRDWLETLWSQRPTHEQERQTAEAEAARLKRQTDDVLSERKETTDRKQAALKQIAEQISGHQKKRILARGQTGELVHWPQDQETLQAGFEQVPDIDALVAERRRLTASLDELREKIRQGVDEIRRQMMSLVGTGPEKFYSNAVATSGYPRSGMEHEWIEVFRAWFQQEHETNRTDLLQRGKTLAQNISSFWKSLDNFKRNISTFASDLRANLEQGRIFETIADVSTEIRAEVDTQSYWEAVGNLHREYETWHTTGDPALPPPSFVDAAKQVALVIGEDKGLVAEPVDLISLKISANVNNQGVKTASTEHELANISSNGLSYIILCVILIGFVNRIRRSENVVVPFVVDELKDLSFANAKTLLDLLTRNNITMISAFPDVDHDLAELFERNYKILPGRKVGLLNFDEDVETEEETAHV